MDDRRMVLSGEVDFCTESSFDVGVWIQRMREGREDDEGRCRQAGQVPVSFVFGVYRKAG